MKFLILFAVAALYGSVHCDQECFRSVFKECVREPVPQERMTLCDEVKYQVTCLSRVAYKCNMPFKVDADDLKKAVTSVCRDDAIKNWFDEAKPCFKKSVNDSVCAEPINEAMSGVKTTEDFINANKKVCNLFEPYSNCVENKVEKNCGQITQVLFNLLYIPLRNLSNSLCEQLILPADEKDSRPDNFGMLNVYASVAVIFESA